MTRSHSRLFTDPPLGHSLGLAGWSLLLIYGATLLSALLQPGSLGAAWIQGLSNALVDQGPIALLGLVLIHLSATLNREDRRLQSRRNLAAALALPAALGFLLLVPLQLQALWQTAVHLPHQQGLANQALDRKLTQTRDMVDQNLLDPGAKRQLLETVSGLQQAAGLSPAHQDPVKLLALPGSELRAKLMANLDEIESHVRMTRQSQGPATGAATLASSLRSIVSSLALALAFLASSRRRGEDLSPILIWQLEREGRRYRKSYGSAPSGQRAMDQLIDQISD